MADNFIFFDDVPVGRKFQVSSKIIYQKISKSEAIPVLTADKKTISNGKVSQLFTNSKIPVTIVS